MSNPPAKALSIALITCSVRPNRINPLITNYVLDYLTSHLNLPNAPEIKLRTIDLATPGLLPALLPFPEPAIPAALPKTDTALHYTDPTTQSWSQEVAKHDAFIFITPQYNWGYPASVKHAIDLLYFEWVRKAAWVISYGGHGGGKCRKQLEQVLAGLKGGVVESAAVEFHIPVEVGMKCIKAGALGEELVAHWKEQGLEKELEKGWTELVGKFSVPAN